MGHSGFFPQPHNYWVEMSGQSFMDLDLKKNQHPYLAGY